MSRNFFIQLLFVILFNYLPTTAQTIPIVKLPKADLTVTPLFIYEPSATSWLKWEKIPGNPVLAKTDSVPDSALVVFPDSKSGHLYSFTLPNNGNRLIFLQLSKAVTNESFEHPQVRLFFRNRFEAQRNRLPLAFIPEPMSFDSDSMFNQNLNFFKSKFIQNADTTFMVANANIDELYVEWNQAVYLQLKPLELIVLEQTLYAYLCQNFSYFVRAGLEDPIQRLGNSAIPEFMPDFKITLNAKSLSSLQKRMEQNRRLIGRMTTAKFLREVLEQTRYKLRILNQSERHRSVLAVKLALKSGRVETVSGLLNELSHLEINQLQIRLRQILLNRKYILIHVTPNKQ